jgi:alanyl-tRNA synthetase
VAKQCAILTEVAALLKQPKNLVKAVETLIYEKSQLQKQLTAYQAKTIQQVTDELQRQLEKVNGTYLLIQEVQVPHADALRQIAFQYKSYYEQIFVVLAAKLADKAQVAIFVSDALLQHSTKNAHDLIQFLAPFIGGNGGGQPFFATAGGDNPEGIVEALKAAKELFTRFY